MRFMMLIYPGSAYPEEWGPEEVEAFAAMGRFNDELTQAGVLLSVDGLQPDSEGARVRYSGGAPTVTDGPFTEAKEVVGGLWIIQATDQAEAVEWAKRIPARPGDFVEVRRVSQRGDFPEHLREALAHSEQTSA